LEGILNKKIVTLNLWWLLGLPLIAVCLLTAVSSFLTLNYEYLPAETDFISVVLYEASYIALDIALGFALGAFCYAVYEKKAVFALVCALVTFFVAALAPMIMFFVRSMFLASTSDANIMEEYFTVDVYVSVSNIIKMLAAILIVLIVRAVFFFGKIEKPLARPRFAPKSEPAIAVFAITAANLIFTTVSFTFSEFYDFVSLAFQAASAVASYFIILLGVYFAHKKCGLHEE
jgi:hypothetical protein